MRFEDEEIRPKLVAIERAEAADTYLTGSIAIEDADELKIEINPQYYPFLVKRGVRVDIRRSMPVGEANRHLWRPVGHGTIDG